MSALLYVLMRLNSVHKNAYKTHIYTWNILGFSSTTEHDDSFVVRYSNLFNVRCCLCVIGTLYTSGMAQSFHTNSNYSFSHSSFFSIDGVLTSEVVFVSFIFIFTLKSLKAIGKNKKCSTALLAVQLIYYNLKVKVNSWISLIFKCSMLNAIDFMVFHS